MSIKAVIFDCDGTLLDSERISLSTWSIMGKEMGFEVPMEVLLENRGKSKEYCKKNILRVMGEDFPFDEIRAKKDIVTEKIFCESENVIKPGVVRLLKWMHENHIMTAVASVRTTEVTTKHLKHAGIYEMFDIVWGGEKVKRNKPEPDLFLKIAEELGVTSEECFVVGDSHSDVGAAYSAKMKMAFVPDLIPVNKEIEEKSYVILKQIDELIEVLENEKKKEILKQ